ncbi:MAG TPA: C25 family cysteine peptidase, partial [Phycisphaerae bacterium]|nr:C25 family cysteine peptidase [Phycisphaerae bacterium]
MKRQIVCIVCLLVGLVCTPVGAQLGDAAKGQGGAGPYTVTYTTTYSPDALSFGRVSGYDTINLEGADPLLEPGRPMLPAETVRLALPADMLVTGVRVVRSTSVDLDGKYTVLPAQPPLPVSSPPQPLTVAPDPIIYASDDPYPGQLVTFEYQNDLAGQVMAVLRFYPVQYVPAQNRLTLYTSIDVVVEGVGGYVCGDYLPARVSEEKRQAYAGRVSDMVANPEAVAVRQSPEPLPVSRGVPAGDYDYVIITQSSWVSSFQPLADWRSKKGIPANIVTTSWIYNEGGYSGTDVQKIRAFVIDAYNNWGTTMVLLGGDTNIVPCHVRAMVSPQGTDNIPNDTYYSDYDDDWLCEVHVGRAAVRTSSQVTTFINKVFTYEKNPPLTDYIRNAAFFGFDAHSAGSGEGEGCKEAIRTQYVPSGWTVRTEYDSEPGTHKTDVIAYLNQGNNLVNHSDHADTTVMGAGATNHGQYLSNSNMSALYNGARQSILYSIGCWACNYQSTTCIAEAFVQNSNGGGIAFVGNSRYGWYSPYTADGLSARYDRYFFRSLFTQLHYTLGECFSDHKNDAVGGDSTMRYIFVELTLLGDPALRIRATEPFELTASHPSVITAGVPTDYQVQVTRDGTPVVNARVCLWKSGDVYASQTTPSNGTITFSITPGTPGVLYVTVTKDGYLPYEGTTTVSGSPVPEACCLPDGSCADLTPAACASQGGTPWGGGTSCATVSCPQPPDPRVIDIGLVPSINPDSVCPGQSFYVYVTLAAIDG